MTTTASQLPSVRTLLRCSVCKWTGARDWNRRHPCRPVQPVHRCILADDRGRCGGVIEEVRK